MAAEAVHIAEEGAEVHEQWLAHHFDTPAQQYASAKLGTWVFLLTEILFFGGLFCAYAVYRRLHPEVFYDGRLFLSVALGATNTVVLLFSSLTMAWAVRCAQTDNQRGLVLCLALTLCAAAVFLGIKYREYSEKWSHHLVPGQSRLEASFGLAGEGTSEAVPGTPPARGVAPTAEHVMRVLREADEAANRIIISQRAYERVLESRVHNLGVFFGIYFALTGLHAIHVICGMIAIGWLLTRAVRSHFSSKYFTPVDCVGLYWHLVDAIWIYLFPLLYLID